MVFKVLSLNKVAQVDAPREEKQRALSSKPWARQHSEVEPGLKKRNSQGGGRETGARVVMATKGAGSGSMEGSVVTCVKCCREAK